MPFESEAIKRVFRSVHQVESKGEQFELERWEYFIGTNAEYVTINMFSHPCTHCVVIIASPLRQVEREACHFPKIVSCFLGASNPGNTLICQI